MKHTMHDMTDAQLLNARAVSFMATNLALDIGDHKTAMRFVKEQNKINAELDRRKAQENK